jgi:hypothetical protein
VQKKSVTGGRGGGGLRPAKDNYKELLYGGVSFTNMCF